MFVRDAQEAEFVRRLQTKCPKLYGLSRQPIEKGVPFHPIQLSLDIGPGWWPLIEELSEAVEKENTGADPFVVVQIKEKYGTLCFYISHGNDKVFDLIHEAEEKSATICENCGKPGILRGESWLYTSCEDCKKDK